MKRLACAWIVLWLLIGSVQKPEVTGAPCGPLWVDASGRPSRDAHDALTLLGGAAGDGLDPLDYAAAALAVEAERLAGGAAPRSDASVAAFEARLTRDHAALSPRSALRPDRSIDRRIPDAVTDAPRIWPSALRAAVAAHRRAGGERGAGAVDDGLSATPGRAGPRIAFCAADPALLSFTPPTMTIHPGERSRGAARAGSRTSPRSEICRPARRVRSTRVCMTGRLSTR